MSDSYASHEDARDYEAWRKRPSRRLSKWFESWRIRRALRGEGRLVDIACGPGRYDAFVSCDYSAGMAALARENGRRALRADARRLPFGDGAFDRAVCVRLIHHFDDDDRRAVLRDLARVAKSAVVTYFGSEGAKARRRASRKKRNTRRALTRAEFAAACAAAGWTVDDDYAIVPLWSENRIARLRH